MKTRTLTAKETAAYFGVHRVTIYRMAADNQLPHFWFRRRLVFLEETLDQWVEDQQQKNYKGAKR